MNAALQRTPLFDEHQSLGGRLVPFAGWEMPVQYEGVVKEHHAVRTAAGLFDVCHMGELHLRGPGALDAVDRLVTNSIKKASVGQAQYTVACNEQGTILDDLIVYRVAEEHALIVCNAGNREKISAHVAKHTAGSCDFDDASDRTALIALQGPKAFEILGRADAPSAILELGPFRLTGGKIFGVDVTVARTGYTGEDGVELFCANDDAASLWRGLLEAGQPLGLVPAGLGARDTLRLEACLSLYGNEIDETTNPIEAGLGWVVKLKKGDFLGREALERVKAEGPTRKLVGFEMTGRGIARHGYPIVHEDKAIGTVTSGSPAPSLGKNVGLGYVPIHLSEKGTPLGIEIRGKTIEAVVAPTPFYKRKG
ncbi:MAG: glycine cleavage system aminomethyltransferase GcvT [Myxococcales bacterium]|nr:glycine cleavage system aminomethyltransferase GcvT [Myxococcales bacterium]